MYDAVVFGGCAESGQICDKLCQNGIRTLLCTATAQELSLPCHQLLSRHCGKLPQNAIRQLLQSSGCRIVICAVHPYAVQGRENILAAAESAGIPCLTYLRAESTINGYEEIIVHCSNHEEAAQKACEYHAPILLTVGSNNAGVYLQQAREQGVAVLARILDSDSVQKQMREYGFNDNECIFDRGPFTVEQNLQHIHRIGAKILVSKDGGEAGGLPQKLQAAREADCKVVLVDRPAPSGDEKNEATHDLDNVLDQARTLLEKNK